MSLYGKIECDNYELDRGDAEAVATAAAAEIFWFFMCCIYPCVGVPVFLCWWCDSCCFKGKGRKSATQAPAPASAAPVIVQVFNNKDSD